MQLKAVSTAVGPASVPGEKLAGAHSTSKDVGSAVRTETDVEFGAKTSGKKVIRVADKDVGSAVRTDILSPLAKGGHRGVGGTETGKQSTVTYLIQDDPPGPPPPTDLVLNRTFVYGLEYIDEQVAQNVPASTTVPLDEAGYSVRYILQDANYNVVAVVKDCYKTVIQQYAYKPYGELLAVEDANGNTVDLATNPTALITHQLFQGHWYDQETSSYSARARTYRPDLGRFNQRDPNGQALMLATALAMNAQTQSAFVSLTPWGQYTDGSHLYQFVGSNPITQTDPSGQFVFLVLAPILGALGGAAYEAASIYSSAADLDMSAGQILLQVAKSAGIGAVIGIGAHAAALGIGAGVGGAQGLQLGYRALGLMFGPAITGKGIQRYRSATEAWDRIMALVDIGSGALATVGGFAGAMSGGAEFAFLTGGRGFRSFRALKASLGRAGPGKAWHHIVEQRNELRFGAQAIQNTKNIIRLPYDMHVRISAHYSSTKNFTKGLTVRKWLSTQSFDKQYQFGLKTLRRFGGNSSQIGK